MFLRDCRASRQARLRCIMSWSRPVVAMAMKMPARNCFQKNVPSLGLSKKNMRDVGWSAIAEAMSVKLNPRFVATK